MEIDYIDLNDDKDGKHRARHPNVLANNEQEPLEASLLLLSLSLLPAPWAAGFLDATNAARKPHISSAHEPRRGAISAPSSAHIGR